MGNEFLKLQQWGENNQLINEIVLLSIISF